MPQPVRRRRTAYRLSLHLDSAAAKPDPLDALAAALDLAEELDQWAGELAAEARAAGYSWNDIAHRLGVTRQSAWGRWGAAARSA